MEIAMVWLEIIGWFIGIYLIVSVNSYFKRYEWWFQNNKTFWGMIWTILYSWYTWKNVVAIIMADPDNVFTLKFVGWLTILILGWYFIKYYSNQNSCLLCGEKFTAERNNDGKISYPIDKDICSSCQRELFIIKANNCSECGNVVTCSNCQNRDRLSFSKKTYGELHDLTYENYKSQIKTSKKETK